jgi:FkbM family methyltransferase
VGDCRHLGSASAAKRAEELLASGPANPWTAPSRFGFVGTWLRRALRRALRPYEVRQREFDLALLSAVSETASDVSLDFATPIAGDAVLEAETPVGALWLHADDRVTTPALRAGVEWEPEVAALLRRELQPGMTFVDIGANIGYFSVLGAHLVGDRGRVAAVECDHRNLPLLRANLWRHRCTRVTLLPVAAYSRRGHLSLIQSDGNFAGTAVVPDATGAILVPCTPLDDVLQDWIPDVVKIDVEGADHLAIAGLMATLSRNSEVIVISEFFPNVPALHGKTPREVLESYVALGFQLSVIGGDGGILLSDVNEILSRGGAMEEYFSIVLQFRHET